MRRTACYTAAVMIFLSGIAFAQVTGESAFENHISLNLKDAPIDTVLYAIGKEAGLNIVSNSAVNGKITISLNKVTPYDALNAILKVSGYNYKMEDGIVRISAPASMKNTEELGNKNGLITKSFMTNYLGPDDIRDLITKLDLENTKVLTAKGSNMIIVEAPIATMQKIGRIIKRIDVVPSQVLVESQIMEVTAGNGATPNVLGINGSYSNSTSTVQTEGFANPAAVGVPGFYAHVIKGGAEGFLEALEHKEGYNLLANPKVIAVSGKPANIISGSKLGYKTTLTTTTGTVQNIDFLEVGTKLTFTPTISDDGTITMDIHPEVSEGSVTTDGLPQKQTTEATTTVIVHDGETIVIGGLIKNKSSESASGVPLLMDIPLFGNLFKRKEITWEKTEIIAVLTPHLITPAQMKEYAGQAENVKQKQDDAGLGKSPDAWFWLK